jgi:uncharacterized protein (DUF885 family)
MTLLPLVVLVLAACAPRLPPESAAVVVSAPDAAPPPTRAAAGVVHPALARVVEAHWEEAMASSPTTASHLGDRRYADRWDDPSDRARAEHVAALRRTELALVALPDEGLSRADRVTRDLLLEAVRSELAERPCRFEEWSISARDNDLVSLRSMVELAPTDDAVARAALLARYQAYPAVVDARTALLRRGLASGRVANRESVGRVVALYDAALAEPVEDTVEYRTLALAFADAPDAPPGATDAVRAAIVDGIRPALARQRDLLRDEIAPAARTGADIGLHALPDGPACYAARIRAATTLSLSPDALHQRGLDEIARIHDEFRALGARVFGTDDLRAVFARLREDPALRFGTADEVRAAAEAALRRAEAAVPAWFEAAPVTPCEVAVVPDYLAPFTTVAYYQPGLPDGARPGRYYVNVSSPGSRLRHEAEVLAFHESVPGHHLQIAIAAERGELPAFRRHGRSDVFVEGWALYAERLADEMGLYSGDTDRLGVLAFDAWRAGRLVVDTGLHARGWSREQAEAWLLENTPLAPENVTNEVDRYVTWPGQALAYKVGEAKIRALRVDAEDRLGDAFRPAAFHRAVLGQGPVTLSVLEATLDRWIEDTQMSPQSPSEVPP